MAFNYIPSPSIHCEKALVSFLSSSLSGSGANIYRGLDNEDKYPPAVIVNCKDITEVVFNSRVYAFDVELTIKEIGADTDIDTTTGSFSSIAGNVFAYFSNDVTSSNNINAVSSGIRFYQCQMLNYNESHEGDAWVNSLNVKLIGALVPPS